MAERQTTPALAILVLTQTNCQFCEEAKVLLGRLAREFPLSVSTLDVNSAEGQVLAARGGVLFPPGIFVDAEPVCYGRPSERMLRREIERRLSGRTKLPPDVVTAAH